MIKRGFTLVELSIVLVIIGLLIGGILAAQSMIASAKINAQIAQIGQFDAGVMNFKNKYNYLASDAPGFGGDGDGIIERVIAGDSLNAFQCEIANFWAALFPEQYKAIACANLSTSLPVLSGSLQNVPIAKIGLAGSFFIASAVSPSVGSCDADIENPRNFYVILVNSQKNSSYFFKTSTFLNNSPLTVAELFALDKKMDDGIANTGNVISGSMATCTTDGVANTTPLSACSIGNSYVVSNTNNVCTPLIRIGGFAGNVQ